MCNLRHQAIRPRSSSRSPAYPSAIGLLVLSSAMGLAAACTRAPSTQVEDVQTGGVVAIPFTADPTATLAVPPPTAAPTATYAVPPPSSAPDPIPDPMPDGDISVPFEQKK